MQCLKIFDLMCFKRSLDVDALKLRSWEFLSCRICSVIGSEFFSINIWELFSLTDLQLYIIFMLERDLIKAPEGYVWYFCKT